MLMKNYIKFIFLCALVFFIGGRSALRAQQLKYDDYSQYQSKFLKSLKSGGGLTSFTSMRTLKAGVATVEENTLVSVPLVHGKKKEAKMEQIVQERRASVPLIWKYVPETTQSDKVITFASAIVLSSDGICATNYHVVRNIVEKSYKLGSGDSILFVSIGEKIYPITNILSYNKTADMALIRIGVGKDVLVPFPVGNDLAAGSPVNTFTHVAGYLNYYTRGVVARNFASDGNDPFTNRMEITAEYAKGSSGGAIFDDYGNLVAMVSNTTSVYYMDNPQINLQMVNRQTIPISSILKLIKQN